MLKVVKNKVANENGFVRLLGVNRAGLEWDSRDKLIVTSVEQACDDWKANIIRLPISQDRWFGKAPEQTENNLSAEDYRKTVDTIIEKVASRGKYLIFELHWSDMNVWGSYIGQHQMPDMNSIIFWKDAANRYKNHSNVLFGLYNEPHSTTWDIWQKGGFCTEQSKNKATGEVDNITYETPGMQAILDAIREEGALNIAVIGGLDWGFLFDGIMDGHEITDKTGNGIILDSHVYPWKPLDWDTYVTVAADKYPILIGECGHYGDEAKPREGAQKEPSYIWVPKLLDWIKKNGYHLTAWDFHPGAGPCLIKSFDNEPTPYYGKYVKDFLIENNK